ncbi:MAG: CGNR zinc finger domain-containing protein [Steroidobacteraceae bacterium]
MDPLALNPGHYAGTYKLIGGRPSLDLVNTISWPGSEGAHDWLDSVGNLERWLRASGLPVIPRKSAALGTVLELRAALTSVLRPLAHREHPTRKAIDDLNQRIAQASSRRIIDPVTLTWTWAPVAQTAEAVAPIVLDAAELIAAGDRDRLRHCPACDWLFEDQTRNGQRRWCDMADCGSRDKARRYYHRTRKEIGT